MTNTPCAVSIVSLAGGLSTKAFYYLRIPELCAATLKFMQFSEIAAETAILKFNLTVCVRTFNKRQYIRLNLKLSKNGTRLKFGWGQHRKNTVAGLQ